MLYGQDSLILCTGLPLKGIAKILAESDSEEDIENALQKHGNKYLDRYKTYRKYKELTFEEKIKEPILPIISGFPGVGKTTLAREVATALGIGNVMGGDSFRAALREFISQDEHPEFFSSIYEAWKFFGDETKENILKGFELQARLVNKAIEKIVADRGLRDGESVVFEYLHFLPSQYDRELLSHPSVIPIVLRVDSESIHRKRLTLRDKMMHFKGKSQRLIDALERYRLMQEHQCEDARRNNVPVVDTDDWEKAYDAILDIIFGRIKKIISSEGAQELGIVEKMKAERRRFQKDD